eukprot:TRINITY_DN22453_c0_g1_i1.p1 TRINITY_DN22453_c0_g1~~TRINITY_DN22453_c0_g1_i1.p1  ORF type:complete len:1764 (+),score=324.70 TRINITY_DN22453_c0_g1_i1:32-5293(+)
MAAAPPPPEAATLRQTCRAPYEVTICEACELHELHSQLGSVTSPVREGLVPVTVISSGRTQLDQRCLVMNPRRSEAIRSVFAAWLKGLVGADAGSTTMEIWGATCGIASRELHVLQPGDDVARVAGGLSGLAAGSHRLPVASVHDALEATERMVSAVDDPSFVAVGLELHRHSLELGCTFVTSALWIDLSSKELLEKGGGVSGIKQTLEGSDAVHPHPLVELLAPSLRGEAALAALVCGPADDPAAQAASDFARQLASGVSAARPARCLDVAAVREGFAPGSGLPSFIQGRILSASFQDLRSPLGSPLPELLGGDIMVRTCGFPWKALPSLRPYMTRFQVSSRDKAQLHLAAETEIAEFEEKGWVVPEASKDASDNRPGGISCSRPLYVQLADCYALPEAELTTTTVRHFARSQDQSDPLVRSITRLRDDVALAVALLPLCAAHPFNALRLLRLGGVHSLLALLSDASALAPGREDMAPAVEALSSSEIAALVLAALAVFAPVRRFLVAQCVFELLAVAIRHPVSERHLLIFAALLCRLCQDPEHRQAASETVLPSLLEQLGKLLDRHESATGVLSEAVAAAAASLSPFIPVGSCASVLPSMLAILSSSAPRAFHFLSCSIALSVRRGNEITDDFVPRMLSLIPLEQPEEVSFHCGAAAVLALCSHTAAITSLSRPWVASAASAILRRSLRAGPGGLASIRVCMPLAAARKAAGTEVEQPCSEWYAEVEEQISMQNSLRWTLRSRGGLSGSPAATCTSGFGFQAGADMLPASPGPTMRQQRLHGFAQLLRLADMAESPNAVLFQETPQIRIQVFDEQVQVFLSLSLLPAACCMQPNFAVNSTSAGLLGFWICELPMNGEPCTFEGMLSQAEHESVMSKQRSHQLDLRPPLHASAASPGKTEHLASVTLPRGLFTLIPFNSHEIMTAQGADHVKSRCRSQGCGCVDLNLSQDSVWELGSRYATFTLWAEATELDVFEAEPWHQRLTLDGELLAQSLPIWLCPAEEVGSPMEVLICITSREENEQGSSLLGSEPCLDLWPAVPHRRVRNERTGALRIHILELPARQPLRVSCVWQEPIDPGRWSRPPPRVLVYSSGALVAHMPPQRPRAALMPLPGELQGCWQAAVLCSGHWTQGFSSGFGSLRNPQVVLEVAHGPGRGEELQLDFYISVPTDKARGKEVQERPKAAITIFTRQEEIPGLVRGPKAPGAPERLVEGQLRKELGASKAAVGGYVTAQLVLSGAEARQPLFAVLQNSSPQESYPWRLRVLARIRRKAGEVPPETAVGRREVPDEPPLSCAVLGGTAEPGRLYAYWPEGLALYVPKSNKSGKHPDFELPEHLSYAWVLNRQEWSESELPTVEATCGAVASRRRRTEALLWPAPDPTPRINEEETAADLSTALRPPPRIPIPSADPPLRSHLVTEESSVKPGTGLADKSANTSVTRRPPVPVPPPPRRLAQRAAQAAGEADAATKETISETPERFRRHAEQNVREEAEAARIVPTQSERHAKVEALMRRRRQGRDRLTPEDEAEASRENQATSLPPPRFRGRSASGATTPRLRAGSGDETHRSPADAPSVSPQVPPIAAKQGSSEREAPKSARAPSSERLERRSPSLPPIRQAQELSRCCHFAGHPVFCCRADVARGAEGGNAVAGLSTKHVVRLERQPGSERLGFGNVAAGPPSAPVLVVSWIRDGVLASWNHKAPEGMAVPVQSAIVSVNGVSGDVQRMREELRAQAVEMEVVAPDRWRYNKIMNID